MFSPDQLEELWFENDGVRLHAVAAGPEDGPAVILLHGFPEFWYGWRHQIGPLAEAGFRVIVPDQRGYNVSSKPREPKDYRLRVLTSDVLAIADHLGRERIRLAGHDWGGAVAWSVALLHPERVHRMCSINLPHPAVALRHLRSNPRQMLRSWYMLFFQVPRVPEALFSAGNYRVGVRALMESSRAGTFSDADLATYREAWSQPGAVEGMINWYRAAFRFRADREQLEWKSRVPVLLLWGERDRFLVPEMASDSVRHCAKARVVWFPQATHWLQHEEPDRVNELLIDFFRS